MNFDYILGEPFDRKYMWGIMDISDKECSTFEDRIDYDNMQLMGGEPYKHPSN